MTAAVIAFVTLASVTMITAAPTIDGSSDTIELFMPNVRPQKPDTYFCRSVKIQDAHRYITSFVPKANAHIAHHMLLYGCEEPGNVPGQIWNCGEMASHQPNLAQGRVCSSGEGIVYAWAMDAPKLNLPEEVGFEIGQDTPIKYLVLQVHYKDVTNFVSPNNKTDNSGMVLHTTTRQTPKLAGVYLMVTGGSIPAHTIEYFESACSYEDIEMVPFAYRTHAHSLGRVISGYRVRNGEWKEIGRKDPRLPEMFYNVTSPGMTIKRGDILAARCTMEDTTDHTVSVGATQADEMCNFYIMYYVERPPLPQSQNCFTPGPPFWYWTDFEDQEGINLDARPSSISIIPGQTKPLISNASLSRDLFGPMSARSFLGTPDSDVTSDNAEIVEGVPGEFQDQSVAENLDEAIREMSPDELLFLIQQLAREEEEANARDKMWSQRQMVRERQLFPY